MRFDSIKMSGAMLVATVALLTSTGCPPPEGGEGEGEGEDPGCEIDRDCGGGFICDKTDDGDDIPAAEDQFGVCLRVSCLRDEDCGAEEKCDVRRGICVPKNLCDPGDADACPTAGEVCQYTGGLPVCAPPPAATGCIVTPAIGYASAGQSLQLEGVGTGAGNKLVPHTTFTWAASAGAVDADGVFTAPNAAGPVTITGTTRNGGATCTSTVNVYAAVGVADSRIVVIDLASRLPVVGAPVAARIAGVNVDGTTGNDGSFTFTGGAAAESVSAFPATHQWHTLIDPPSDVIIYTANIANASNVDGVKGGFNFDRVKTRGDIKLGLAGTAINAAITDLNFDNIIGELVPTTIDISGITEPGGQEVTLPEGLVIGLGAEDFKGDYVALSDKDGQSVAWALAGRVALSKVGPIISTVTAGGDELDFGAILGAVLPFFATFDHAVVTGLDFTPAARADGDPNFETVTITPDTLMALSTEYDMPRLPCSPGAFANNGCNQDIFLLEEGDNVSVVTACPNPLPAGATCEETPPFTSGSVLLSGVIVPGQGLVPLGLSAALDVVSSGDEPDGVMAQSGENPPPDGTVLLDYAPPHDGIEGNLYVTVAIALDINQITSADDLGASIITQVSRQLPATGSNFNGNTFLESQGGTFSPGADGSVALTKNGAADFYRVNLDDDGEQEWNVWFAGTEDGFDIDALAINSDVDVSDRTVHADVQAFKLGTGYEDLGPSPSDFDDLFGFNGTDIDNLLYYLGGWSSESCKVGGLCSEN